MSANHQGQQIPNLGALGNEREQRAVQVAVMVLQLTPPMVVVADKLIEDDVYKARQAAARALTTLLGELMEPVGQWAKS